ncbi:outer membrane beta-barrel protein [Chryseobacterium sp. SIMBA_029]|uniref:outer membrane beta-barrel protein n=1 Tax=Chryseobacterium sp. SIMBA_029 TaxID=3085772 RepID=UPI0039792A44
MSNQWLNDLRKKMEDHEQDVPDGLWENIGNELFSDEDENMIPGIIMEDDPQEVQKGSGSRNPSLLYRISGIAASIVMIFFVSKKLWDSDSEKESVKKVAISQTKNKKAEYNNPLNNPKKSNTEWYSGSGIDLKNNNLSHSIESSTLNDIAYRNIENTTINRSTDVFENAKIDIQNTENLFTKNNTIIENSSPVNENKETDSEELITQPESKLQENYAAVEKMKSGKKHSKKAWMLSMLTGNASSNATEQQFPGYATMSGSPMSVDQVWSSANYDDDPLMEILLANQNEQVEAKLRHKIPITLGVSLYYNLGKKWGIGTGINYTKLSSELHSGSASNYIKGDQSVHYLGVPVQVNYTIIKKGSFTGYATAGALVEKAVAGKLRTKYIVNDEIKETSEEQLNIKPVQFSVNTGIGLQLKVIDKFGIYAEPGIGYHFKDNSALNTIYKEKPLNFNVKFGIRLMID